MPLLCPGCRSELTPEAHMCGVCLRPRDRNEIFRGIHQLQQEQKAARQRPKIIAGLALGLAVLAGAGYKFGPQMRAVLLPPPPAPAPAPAPQAQPEPAAPAPALAPEPVPAAETPLKNELPPELARAYQRKAAGEEPEPASAGAQWKVRGLVYDLLSLKPVKGARLTFTHAASGKRHAVKTGADGRYSIVLPPAAEGGYKVDAAHPAYRPSFLEETEPPYRVQSEARRVEAARLIINSEVLHVPLQPPEEAAELTYDVVLSPLPD